MADTRNYNCDGGRCRTPKGEVRIMRLGPKGTLSGNLHLCHYCWNYENYYNRERANETGNRAAFPQHDWEKAEIAYDKDGNQRY